MNDILKKIELCGIVPVVKISKAENAVPLAKALLAGGINVAEITFRTDAAADAIKNISSGAPEMLVGAGTVLTVNQADEAISSGAKFIVTPGWNPDVVKHCISLGVTVIPGCATCGECISALSLGLDTVKYFPAEALGGAAAVKAISAPFSGLHFLPTGGISEDNLLDYLSIPSVIACGGSFMVKESLISEGKFGEIEKLTYRAVAKMHGFALKHVGINCRDEGECNSVTEKLCKMTMNAQNDLGGTIFAGSLFEIFKSPYLGRNGHIAISCNFPFRAVDYLARLGFEPDMSTAAFYPDGKLRIVYFKDEIGGFAVHIVNK